MSTPAGDAGADGEGAGVAERAVADVLDEVRLVDERRQADPRHALRAHRRGRHALHARVARLEVHDPVAADAAADERAVGDDGRAVVRAPAAEGRARDPGAAASGSCVRATGGGRRGASAGSTRARIVRAPWSESSSPTERREHRRRPRRACRARGTVLPRLVQDAAELRLDERPLLLDHDHARRPTPRTPRIVSGTSGYVIASLRMRTPDGVEVVERHAEVGERLHDVEVGLAGAHDAERRARAAHRRRGRARCGARRPARRSSRCSTTSTSWFGIWCGPMVCERVVVPRLAVDEEVGRLARRVPVRRRGRRCRCRRRPR